ncbi:hypothetical protein EIN_347160 [Entamoeba invadens IP1]|uniref:EGF-like domain-containing protein n=1 Tax=Entamoeba invadens IP1 TaxID=370355 RepID=L7FLJ3_ENTIV|nr:hypothetical protein EIN_347160 [Entamoeba invadens IP1]ELP84029.1 hypothetical protein EIN_347160 [Entamoeba invadens IP1]|eukprot:XP_004183375.1 hypothetical protein EIN_347160 [Entamoeba invadens IP1]
MLCFFTMFMFALSIDWCWEGDMLQCFNEKKEHCDSSFVSYTNESLSLFGGNSQIVRITCTSILALEIDIPNDLVSIWILLNNTKLLIKTKNEMLVNKNVENSEYFLFNDFMKTSKNNTSNLKSGGVNCGGYYNKYCLSCMSGKMSCKQCEDGYSPMYDINDGYDGEIVQCANVLTTTQYWWCGTDNENYLDSNKKCRVQNCYSGDVAGSKGTAGTCKQCKNDYTNYYDNYCHICERGKYYDGHDCVNCRSRCLTCLYKDKCTSCNSKYSNNYYGFCYKCEKGFYFDIDVCNKCMNECGLCSSKEKCDICINGYYIYDNSCFVCPEGCSTCYYESGQIYCETCLIGYYLDLYSCKKCINCLRCKSDTVCIKGTCSEGYYEKQVYNYVQYYYEYQCIACKEGCLTCTSDECLMCKTGFYLQSGVCVTCPNTCSLCSTTSAECIECQQNYVFQNPKTIECDLCSSFDINCKTCDSSFLRRCYECQSGYYPSSSTNMCIKCSLTCESNGCNTVTGECQTCADNYTITSTPGVDCGLCSDFDSNCETCLKTTRKCNKCKASYYPQTVSPFMCQQCDETCGNKCDQEYGYCTSCKLGYVLKLDKQSLICESCQSFDPICQTCASNGERKCITCKDITDLPVMGLASNVIQPVWTTVMEQMEFVPNA